MAVVLTILKILGIILLSLIGLAILLLLMVLFIPIRYYAEGEFSDERRGGIVRVRWFIFRFLGEYAYKSGFHGKAKVGWITVKTINGDEDVGHKKEEPPEIPTGDQPEKKEEETEPAAEPLNEEDSQTADTDTAEMTTSGAETEEQEDAEIFGPGKPAETKQEEKERKKREKAKAKAEKAQRKKEPKPEKPPEERIGYKIEQIMNRVETKYRHIRQFLDKDFTKRTIERGKKLIVKFLKHLKPKKGGIFLRVGFSTAASTGMFLGKIAWLYPIYGRWLIIEPDFYNKVIEVKGSVKGRIRIGSLAIPALIFYLRKDTRRTIKMAKKI